MASKFRLTLLCAVSLLCSPDIGAAADCTQSNALSVLINGTSATAYVPNGAWSFGATGIRVVPLEGGGTPATIATPGIVDSCAANSTTQQVVCTATDSDVYLIHGTTLDTTLQSAGIGIIGFSGGVCGNCGVAIDTVANIAWIEEATSNNVPAVQSLNLYTNKFDPPLPLANGVSESIVVDPVHNVLLSATEQSWYDIIKGSPPVEYGNYNTLTPEYDSSAEDCTTGLMIATDEATSNLYFANYNQVTFGAGNWTAPGGLVDFPEFQRLSAGTTGISVAPNSHYAALAGEFGGSAAGFVRLPQPKHLLKHDYVAAYLPIDWNGKAFQNGYDPHTVTTYTSPKDGKAYAVFEDWADGAPDFLLVVDIAKMLAAPRVVGIDTTGPHLVDPNYKLISHLVVHYVPTFPVNSGCLEPHLCY